MTILERYEWCDLWWDETGEPDKPRVLLIGDSIAKGYYPFVRERLKAAAHVDRLTTSKSLDNPSLRYELDYFIRRHPEFRYAAIHFNNGLHGKHLSAAAYEEHYDRLIRYMAEQSDARIIPALTTPVTTKGAGTPFLLERDVNGLVLERNRAVLSVAAKYVLEVHDLYVPMLGRSEYRAEDGVHYNERGQRAQAALVAEAIGGALRHAGKEE